MENLQQNLRSIQAVPSPYRNVFGEYPCFNVVQSTVFDEAMNTDNSLVVSAPTGSGKTAIFEMAIIRHLMLAKESPVMANKKIIYISPIKALCKERLIDWHKKFSDFGLGCISATSDSNDFDVRSLAQYNLIIATPEKWDVITRRWRETPSLIGSISLFLVDEVHLLNADSRGSTLEVIVNRMKTAVVSMMFNHDKSTIRFIALSATIPNIEDIAEWIGPSGTAKSFKFSEEVRPVRLNKIVLGYYFNPQNQTNFKFDMSLSYKLAGLISKYSEGKPTLIFCNTRKSVEMTANHLVTNLQIRLSQEQKEVLFNISGQLNDPKLKQYVVHGMAFHHAGLVSDNRYIIEESFRKGCLPVLVTTSTLAMGVNLPAHLVIVKSTKCYNEGGYKDYDEVSIFQMIGRAGRSQFDTSATALILTSLQDKEKYEHMLGCTQTIESNLHKHLTEHLNAEVVLRTITDLDVAMRWLSSTFLYVRARRSPERYKLPAGLSKEKIDKKLLEMCQIDLNKLVRAGMIQMNQDIEISPTVVGEIMAKYYVAFDTMKLFTQIAGTEILIQILAIISKCKEFSEIYLRTNDKRCLNMLNKNSNKESNRFPLVGKIKTVDMKVNCIIQAVLGNLEITDQSILCDSIKIMRNCERLTKYASTEMEIVGQLCAYLSKCANYVCKIGLIEYLETRDNCFNAMLNTTILAKCFRVKLWENSPYVSKQLTGVGRVISTLLMKAGKTNFKEIASTNPRHIEMIVGRKAPFGNNIVTEASHVPEYTLRMEKNCNTVGLIVDLLNPENLEEQPTISLDSIMTLLVGDSNNNILLYEKYTHAYMVENPKIRRSIDIENQALEFIKAHLISGNWVGFDCFCKLELTGNRSVTEANQNKNCKQTFLEMYMPRVQKANTYRSLNKNGKNAKENTSYVNEKVCPKKSNNTTKSIQGVKTFFKENPKGHDIDNMEKGNLPLNQDKSPCNPSELVYEFNKTTENIEAKDLKSSQKSTKKHKKPKKGNVIISKSIFHTTTKNKPEKKLKRSKSKKEINEDEETFLSESQRELIMEEFRREPNIIEEVEEGAFAEADFSKFEEEYDKLLNKSTDLNELMDKNYNDARKSNKPNVPKFHHHVTTLKTDESNRRATIENRLHPGSQRSKEAPEYINCIKQINDSEKNLNVFDGKVHPECSKQNNNRDKVNSSTIDSLQKKIYKHNKPIENSSTNNEQSATNNVIDKEESYYKSAILEDNNRAKIENRLHPGNQKSKEVLQYANCIKEVDDGGKQINILEGQNHPKSSKQNNNRDKANSSTSLQKKIYKHYKPIENSSTNNEQSATNNVIEKEDSYYKSAILEDNNRAKIENRLHSENKRSKEVPQYANCIKQIDDGGKKANIFDGQNHPKSSKQNNNHDKVNGSISAQKKIYKPIENSSTNNEQSATNNVIATEECYYKSVILEDNNRATIESRLHPGNQKSKQVLQYANCIKQVDDGGKQINILEGQNHPKSPKQNNSHDKLNGSISDSLQKRIYQPIENSVTNNEQSGANNPVEKEESYKTSSSDHVLEDELFNTSAFAHLLKKYKREVKLDGKTDESFDGRTVNSSQGEVIQRNMDYPDSTAEYGAFQRRDFFSPHTKRQKTDESSAFPFEVFPSRSVKWRSPLIHSSAEKWSPHNKAFRMGPGEFRFENNKEDTKESNEIRLGTQDNTSSSSMNSNPFENSEKRLNRSSTSSGKTSERKKANYQFPLRDQDYIEEVMNESFNKKMKGLEGIADLEYFGVTNKKKESPTKSSVWSKSQAGKYYNQLIMNSQGKVDRNDFKTEQSTQPQYSQSKPEAAQETQHNVASLAKDLKFPKPSPIKGPEENVRSQQNPVMQPFVQPVPTEYHRNAPNITFPKREFIEHVNPAVFETTPEPDNYLNLSPVVPHMHFNHSANEFAQRPNFNRYLYEHRYQTSPYFSHQGRPEVLTRFPVSCTRGPHTCMCCTRHPPKYLDINPYYDPYIEPMVESNSCCDYMDAKHRHAPGQAFRSRISDIPEGYIDQCLQQLDEHPMRFIQRPPAAHYAPYPAPDRTRPTLNNCDKENVNPDESFSYNHINSQHGEVGCYRPSCKDATEDSGDRTQERQILSRAVGQIFAPTPRRLIAHQPPGFRLAQNSKSVNPLTSIPPSAGRRMMNFQSFEERLDNMIVPRSQTCQFAGTRDQRFEPPPGKYNGGAYQT